MKFSISMKKIYVLNKIKRISSRSKTCDHLKPAPECEDEEKYAQSSPNWAKKYCKDIQYEIFMKKKSEFDLH